MLSTSIPPAVTLSLPVKAPAETLPASYRAISLVSCRAVAILIMSFRRGIPPSLISRGQYLSAVGRQGQTAGDQGRSSLSLGPRNPSLAVRTAPSEGWGEGPALIWEEPCLPSPSPPGGGGGGESLEKLLPTVVHSSIPPCSAPPTPLLTLESIT